VALLNRVKSLFGKTSQVPTLSPYTVEHEKLDEFILNDMREHSTRFENVLTKPVEIEKDDGSKQTYEQALDLRSDLFFAHHVASDEVSMKDREEVRPSAQLNAEIMRAFTNHEDFLKTRPMTRRDEVASTLATMAAQETLEQELRTTLAQQAEKANDAANEEERIRRAQQELEEARRKAKELHDSGQGIPDELKQVIKGAIAEREDAGKKLETICQGQGSLSGTVAEAVSKAAKDAKALSEVYVSLPGVGIGVGQRVPPEQAIELAYKWREAPNLKRMAELLGRFERDFRYKRSNRIVGGDDIIVGVDVGNDIKKLLPMEFSGLIHPSLKRKFYRDFASRQLLQYEMVGEAEAGKGPIILCIDASGSMSGQKNEWARAVALAVTSIAHREKRAVYVIEFTSVVTGEWYFDPKGGIDPEVATDFAMSFHGGGTDITRALDKAKEIFDRHPVFKTADVMVVTDGSDHMGDEDLELKDYFERRGVRLQGVVIGMQSTPYTKTICHDEVSVYDFVNTSEATDRIVQGLT
jgi:uncharacterized protein with von Willebrand factor type A (vWA) domain